MNWKKLLHRFCKLKKQYPAIIREEIDLIVQPDEILVRGILHPFFYSESKKQLKEQALLPPRHANTVSLNRLRYTNVDFCKQHAKTIAMPDNTYCGLAVLKNVTIQIANSQLSDFNMAVIASPMDEKGHYIDKTTTKVYIDSLGLPMHADLTYKFTESVEAFSPQTKLRKFVAQFVKQNVIYYPDPHPNEEKWRGESIEY